MMKKHMTITRRTVAILLAVALVTVLFAGALGVSGVAYEGKGTKSNPYLVKTPEQLQGMKDKPTAHYKLANTIDLSSIENFIPIGYLDAPFKGSFTCDTNEDGTPKYVIKNLKIYNDRGERYGHRAGANNYVDYVEKKSKWETGLFGCTNGATISNIALYNVDITNTVVGQNRMNGDWSLNPGQDDQATAALIALCENTTVTNCSATGKITSRSNNTGGLIGRVEKNSVVSQSYSAVNIHVSGYWNNGGFMGGLQESQVSDCFAEGELVYTYTHPDSAGFVGSVTDASAENCYSSGSVSGGVAFANQTAGEVKFINCVSTATVSNYNPDLDPVSKVENCYYADGEQQLFVKDAAKAEATVAAINAKVAVISDYEQYVPEKVDTPAGTEPDDAPEETTPSTSMKAEEMETLAKTLNEKIYKGEMTWEEMISGLTIKTTYIQMDAGEQAKVSKGTVSLFNEIYDKTMIQVIGLITNEVTALPEADAVTGENAEQVLAVWEKYSQIPETVLTSFQEHVVAKMTACYEAAKNFEGVTVITTEVDATVSSMQRMMIVMLIVANVIALAVLAVLIAVVIKAVKSVKKA